MKKLRTCARNAQLSSLVSLIINKLVKIKKLRNSVQFQYTSAYSYKQPDILLLYYCKLIK